MFTTPMAHSAQRGRPRPMKPVTVVIRVVRLMTATLAPKSFSMVFMLAPLSLFWNENKIARRAGECQAPDVDKIAARHYNTEKPG